VDSIWKEENEVGQVEVYDICKLPNFRKPRTKLKSYNCDVDFRICCGVCFHMRFMVYKADLI